MDENFHWDGLQSLRLLNDRVGFRVCLETRKVLSDDGLVIRGRKRDYFFVQLVLQLKF